MQMHQRSSEADDEAFARLFEADDEAQDDEGILDDIGRVAGRLLDPIGIFRGIAPSGPSGVQSARINTPQGSAQLRLPEPVVTERVFKESMTRLETALNGLRGQVNNERTVLRNTVRRQDQLLGATRKALRKLESRRQQDQWLGMLTTMMQTQQSRRALLAHTHGVAGEQVNPGSVPNDNSTFLMLLPMFMGGDDMSGKAGESSNDSSGGGMMSMMMMMMMQSMNK